MGETGHFTLARNGSKDFSVSLGKGSYRLVWDTKRVDGRSSNLLGAISLHKPNGVIIKTNILNLNEIALAYRVGTVLNVTTPYVARFRVKNDENLENWFTVVPVNPAKRVPFGWGVAITPARIASDNGVGGTIEGDQSIYHSITLPKGKWSISLGLSLPDNESSNLLGNVDLLDTLGFAVKPRLVTMNEIGTNARTEGIVTVTKPTPYLLRVTNADNRKVYNYDVTIEPAS